MDSLLAAPQTAQTRVRNSRPLHCRVALILSVKPRWASMLLDGIKLVEFRRRGPGPAAIGKHVLIYASSPLSSLVGHAIALDCTRSAPKELWDRYATCGGLSRIDFDAYFAGTATGEALLVRCSPFPAQISLRELRNQFNCRPPISWSWLNEGSPLLTLLPTKPR
jgi:predicted transcriptional regulator